MSLSFNVPFKALTSIGISLSDVALIAGIGRPVGSWLVAKVTDQNLFEILGVEKEEFVPRKASSLVNVGQLNARWSERLLVFQDGHYRSFTRNEIREVLRHTNLDSFTWLMTLIATACFAACTNTGARLILSTFLARRFLVEHDEAYIREMQKNIDSWQSTARSRTILQTAEALWAQLAIEGHHQPGSIPDNDCEDIVDFLDWLIGASHDGPTSREFRTDSSDTKSLAMLLRHVGVECLQTAASLDEILESELAVILDYDRLSQRDRGERPKRKGIRINMNNLEEVVSLWPGTSAENNRRRSIFCRGMRAAEGIEIWPGQRYMPHTTGAIEPLHVYSTGSPGRISADIQKICEEILLLPSTKVEVELTALFDSLGIDPIARSCHIDAFIQVNPNEMPAQILEELQIFVLGYYYGLFRPLIDTSRMAVVEGFGSWTWNDLEFVSIIKSRSRLGHLHHRTGTNKVLLHRVFALRVCAYLFAGASYAQIKALYNPCCGLHGKLTICDLTLLGDVDSAEKLPKFALLDVDMAAIPCRNDGLMFPGNETIKPFRLNELALGRTYAEIAAPVINQDFTSIIQPDWNSDRDSVLLSYRRQGRKITTLSPHSLYCSILGSLPGLIKRAGADGLFYRYVPPSVDSRSSAERDNLRADLRMQTILLEQFDGGYLQLYDKGTEDRTVCLVKTNRLPKARSCVIGLYGDTDPGDWMRDTSPPVDHGLLGALVVQFNHCDIIIE